MQIIPAINEISFEEVKKKIKATKNFGSDWVHLDAAGGKFTKNKLWNNPADLLKVKSEMLNVKIEVHLMVENPDEVFEDWIDAGVKRIIVHLESVKDIETIKEKCELLNVDLFLAIKPDTKAEKLFEYGNRSDGFLILSVNPGLAGQKFQESQLDKIRALRQKFPDVKIEVDGGVNLETASKIKEAGADIIVSASYIWESRNPKEAYLKLKNI